MHTVLELINLSFKLAPKRWTLFQILFLGVLMFYMAIWVKVALLLLLQNSSPPRDLQFSRSTMVAIISISANCFIPLMIKCSLAAARLLVGTNAVTHDHAEMPWRFFPATKKHFAFSICVSGLAMLAIASFLGIVFLSAFALLNPVRPSFSELVSIWMNLHRTAMAHLPYFTPILAFSAVATDSNTSDLHACIVGSLLTFFVMAFFYLAIKMSLNNVWVAIFIGSSIACLVIDNIAALTALCIPAQPKS